MTSTEKDRQLAERIYEAVSRRKVGCPEEEMDLPERLLAESRAAEVTGKTSAEGVCGAVSGKLTLQDAIGGRNRATLSQSPRPRSIGGEGG